MRTELDKLLSRKIKEPSLDITAEGKGVVAAVVEFNGENPRGRSVDGILMAVAINGILC